MLLTWSSFLSSSKERTWEPIIGAQFLRVNTFRMKGSFSPCRITMFAIWMTGSISGLGNIPGQRKITCNKKT